MGRKKIKRLLALLKAKVEYPGRKLDPELPEGFKKSFESQPAFRGWINYHETWDVDPKDPWTVIPLKRSKVAEWHRILIKVVPVITPDGTIMEAEDWVKKSASMD
jgi:hypothetical protein